MIPGGTKNLFSGRGYLNNYHVKSDDTIKPIIIPQGNMNSSIIRILNGKTIMLQYDITSPRVYSRIHTISGTKGIYQKYPLPGRISQGKDDWFNEQEMDELTKEYTFETFRLYHDAVP